MANLKDKHTIERYLVFAFSFKILKLFFSGVKCYIAGEIFILIIAFSSFMLVSINRNMRKSFHLFL